LSKIKLVERLLKHDRVEVTFASRVDLNGCLRACRGRSVSIDRSGNVTIDNRHAEFVFKPRQRLLDQGGLPRAGRRDDIDGKHIRRVDTGAILFRKPVIGIQNIFNH
jgi:hypothetical protein